MRDTVAFCAHCFTLFDESVGPMVHLLSEWIVVLYAAAAKVLICRPRTMMSSVRCNPLSLPLTYHAAHLTRLNPIQSHNASNYNYGARHSSINSSLVIVPLRQARCKQGSKEAQITRPLPASSLPPGTPSSAPPLMLPSLSTRPSNARQLRWRIRWLNSCIHCCLKEKSTH